MRYLPALLMLCLALPAAPASSPAWAEFTHANMAPPPADVIARVMDDPDCSMGEGFDRTDMWEATTLAPDTRLHIIPCYLAAYNVLSKIVIERREGDVSTFDVQSFADYSSLYGWTGSDTLTNAFVNPETGQLAHFHKGRGVGDCGSTGSWEWTGYLFAMIEYRVEEECNGRMPGDWPVVFSRAPAFGTGNNAGAE